MNKLINLVLWTLLFTAVFTVPAYADIATGPVYAVGIGVIVLIIAVFIVLTALLIKVLRRRQK